MNVQINVVDRRANLVGASVIVCGNSGNTVTFSFDAEWSGLDPKTARFVYTKGGALKYQDVVFYGAQAEMPLLANIDEVLVGVFSGDLRTTTPAVIPCKRSIRCGTGEPEDPTPSQYDQIIKLLQEAGQGDWLHVTGGTMSGAINMAGHKVTGLPTAENEADAIPLKQVVDLLAAQRSALEQNLSDHKGDKNNPHGVTAEQVGATPASHAEDKNNPHGVTIEQIGAAPASHATDQNNPHGVTAAQTGAVVADNNRGDIAEGSDLNDDAFLVVGAWRCPLNKTAAGLLNCPVNVAFTMDVLSGTGQQNVVTNTSGYLIQRITTYIGDVYFRQIYAFSSTGKVFCDWKHFYSDQLKPTLEELGAAPSGYGLGGQASRKIMAEDNASGFFGTEDTPDGRWAWGTRIRFNEHYTTEEATNADGVKMQRIWQDGVAGEWKIIGGVDAIVEQGTSGSWTYRKWASGIAECWGTFEDGILSTTQEGSLYYALTTAKAYPFTFVKNPFVQVSPAPGGNGYCIVASVHEAGTVSQTPIYALARPNNAYIYNSALSIYAIGKWK